MKLEYFDLLSPEPIHIKDIGHIKSPTLREISKIRYAQYNQYLNILLFTPEDYYNNFEKDKVEWFKALDDDSKSKIFLYDLIINNKIILYLFLESFNFFFEETIVFNTITNQFVLYESEEAVKNEDKPVGIIDNNNFYDVCDIILQRNNIFKNYANEDFKKVKNNRALEILKKLKKGQEKQNKINKYDKKVELPNVISALASYHNSLNMTNIWDMTVYQIYDQFKRVQNNSIYNIESTSISVWGDKENKFDSTKWYQLMDY